MSRRAIKPIFLFSLPRSGSTLLQRLLNASDEIATVSEPWILLPLMYAGKTEGIYSEYHCRLSAQALEDFIRILPNGMDDYQRAIRALVIDLYGKAAPASRFFLDKTPRYSVIAPEVAELFPDARYIFLWRNPLAVVASCLDTWWGGKWSVGSYKIDLFKGLERMLAAQQLLGEQALSLRFEDLLKKPEDELGRIGNYLGLKDTIGVSLEYGSGLSGRMGDPTGIRNYSSVSEEPLEKWKATLANPLRKAWCRNYLGWIGRDRLRQMGYDMTGLLEDIEALPLSMSNLLSDLYRMPSSAFKGALDFYPLKHKFRAWREGRKVYANR